MRGLLQRFSDRLHAAATELELEESLTNAASELNFPNFAYLSLARNAMGRPQVITTYPDRWATRYLGQAYQKIDPVVHQALARPGPFSWGTPEALKPLSSPQLQFFDEAAEFGIRCGFTVPFHDSAGRLSALTYATDTRPAIFMRDLRRTEDALHLMAMYFHIHVHQKLGSVSSAGGALLSPRETQCLKWAARGKTQWEVARILGITRRTVAFHLDNTRAKLDAVTIAQAVAKAVREGLIPSE